MASIKYLSVIFFAICLSLLSATLYFTPSWAAPLVKFALVASDAYVVVLAHKYTVLLGSAVVFFIIGVVSGVIPTNIFSRVYVNSLIVKLRSYTAFIKYLSVIFFAVCLSLLSATLYFTPSWRDSVFKFALVVSNAYDVALAHKYTVLLTSAVMFSTVGTVSGIIPTNSFSRGYVRRSMELLFLELGGVYVNIKIIGGFFARIPGAVVAFFECIRSIGKACFCGLGTAFLYVACPILSVVSNGFYSLDPGTILYLTREEVSMDKIANDCAFYMGLMTNTATLHKPMPREEYVDARKPEYKLVYQGEYDKYQAQTEQREADIKKNVPEDKRTPKHAAPFPNTLEAFLAAEPQTDRVNKDYSDYVALTKKNAADLPHLDQNTYIDACHIVPTTKPNMPEPHCNRRKRAIVYKEQGCLKRIKVCPFVADYPK